MKERMELPDGWVSEKLGDVCHTTSGGTPSRKNPDYYIGSIPWVKSGELDKGLILDTEEKISEAAIQNSSAKIFPKGTLLIALYGATIGKLGFLGTNAATNQAICGIFKNEILELEFLRYYLFNNRHKLIEQGAGGAQPNISQTILKNLDIVIPPLPEQHRIVAKIEALFTSLDLGIASLKTAQQQLKIYRQAVLKWAFEGKLTNEGVKDGELPEGWKWVKLGNIAEAVDPHPSHRTPPVVTDGVPYVGIGDIDKNYTKFDFLNARKVSLSILDEHVQRYDICKGDFVIGKIGTIGKPFKIPTERFYALSANVVLIKPKNASCNSEYLYNVTNSMVIESQFKKGSKATTQAAFGIQKVRTLEIPLPLSLEEQHNIVAAIESRLSICDKLEETILQSLQQAEALRQSILKKAFAGQLVPQDPNDEPASVLLERIRAERLKATTGKIVKNKKSDK